MPSSTPLAGPSSTGRLDNKQHKSEMKAKEGENVKSGEFIDSSASESSDSEISGSESDPGSIDSEADLEAIEPRKKGKPQKSAGTGARSASLPKYAPPSGMSRATIDVGFKDSAFEYERLTSKPSLQLWAIRVPLDLKTSRLSSLSIVPPTASQGPSGSFKHKSTTYKLVTAGQPTTSKAAVDNEGRQPTAGPGAADSMIMSEESMRMEGGEEMSGGMRLLVPRFEQDGSLFIAPLAISQQLLLEPEASTGALRNEESTQSLPSYLSKSQTETVVQPVAMEDVLPSKRPQPVHLLKFRNRAYGFDTPGPIRLNETADSTKKDDKNLEPASSQEKKKKRRSEGKGQSSPRKKTKV